MNGEMSAELHASLANYSSLTRALQAGSGMVHYDAHCLAGDGAIDVALTCRQAVQCLTLLSLGL